MLGENTTREVPKIKTSAGRKVFNGFAILTLIAFLIFALFITIGTITIPSIRGDGESVEELKR